MNLLTKFRKFWRTLSPLEQKRMWNIMSALRGEDTGNFDVKMFTTARIRGVLFGKRMAEKAHYDVVIATTPKKVSKEIKLDFRSSGTHFYSHIRSALRALKPYVKKEKFIDLLKFL